MQIYDFIWIIQRKLSLLQPYYVYEKYMILYKMKKITFWFLLIVGTIALFPYELMGKTTISKDTVFFHKDTLRLVVGDIDTMRATVIPHSIPIHWDCPAAIPVIASIAPPISSNPYDSLHVITARKPGKTKVLIEAGDARAVCYVYVSPKIILKDTIRLNAGETDTIQARINPPKTLDITKRLFSNGLANFVPLPTNPFEGVITAPNMTDTTLVIAEIGGYRSLHRDTCFVITRVPVDSIRLDNDTIRLNQSETDTLRATVYPLHATDRSLIWKAAAGSAKVMPAASIDAAAIITGDIAADTTLIIVESIDGGKRDTCVVITLPPNTDAAVEITTQNIWSSEGFLHICSDKPAPLYIYTISGALYQKENVVPGEHLVALPRGIYIIHSGNIRKKIVIR